MNKPAGGCNSWLLFANSRYPLSRHMDCQFTSHIQPPGRCKPVAETTCGKQTGVPTEYLMSQTVSGSFGTHFIWRNMRVTQPWIDFFPGSPASIKADQKKWSSDPWKPHPNRGHKDLGHGLSILLNLLLIRFELRQHWLLWTQQLLPQWHALTVRLENRETRAEFRFFLISGLDWPKSDRHRGPLNVLWVVVVRYISNLYRMLDTGQQATKPATLSHIDQ